MRCWRAVCRWARLQNLWGRNRVDGLRWRLSFLARVTQAARVAAGSTSRTGLTRNRLPRRVWIGSACSGYGAELLRSLAARISENAFRLPEKFLVPPEVKKGLHGGGFGPHPRTESKGLAGAVSELLRPRSLDPRDAQPQSRIGRSAKRSCRFTPGAQSESACTAGQAMDAHRAGACAPPTCCCRRRLCGGGAGHGRHRAGVCHARADGHLVSLPRSGGACAGEPAVADPASLREKQCGVVAALCARPGALDEATVLPGWTMLWMWSGGDSPRCGACGSAAETAAGERTREWRTVAQPGHVGRCAMSAAVCYACVCVREFPAQALLRLRPGLREPACVVMEGNRRSNRCAR